MSIQNKRVEHLTEVLLKENLQNGILPDSKEFIWQLNQAMKKAGYDKPSFKFKPYRNTEIASSYRYNKDNEKLYSDLFVLYKNIISIHQLLNKQYQGFVVEREKLEKQLDILENRLKQFIENNNRPGILPYAYETFDTTEKIDLDKTSKVFVNTQTNAAHLVEEKNTSRRIFPESETSFFFLPEGIEKKEETLVGELANIFSDMNDVTWQKQLLLKNSVSVEGVLHTDFKKAHALNRIELSVFTVKPLFFSVTYTPDGSNWFTLPYHKEGVEIEKRIALDFPTIDIKGLRLSFRKNEYDESLPEKDGFDYQYLFGIEQLSFYQKHYPTKGVLTSTLLDLQNKPENYIVDTVQLSVDEWIPTGTDIKYEVALPGDTLDWQPISPIQRKHPLNPQTIRFQRLSRNEKQELFLPKEFSIKQSEAEDLLKNGIPLYRLSSFQNKKQKFELPKIKILEGSIRLYVGKGMWEVSSYPSSDVSSIPSIEDFQKVMDGQNTSYQTVSSVKSGDIFKNKKDTQTRKYLTRIGFYMEESTEISSSITSTEPIAVYLNGEELFKGSTEMNDNIHYVFKSGWNELVVLINGKNATTVNGMTVALGFNPYNLTSEIFASSSPLKEISLFDLQYNTKINDRTVFAKRETAKGLEILTNFGQSGLVFEIYYDYHDELEKEEGLFFRAFFERENGDNVPTPILRNYRLEFK